MTVEQSSEANDLLLKTPLYGGAANGLKRYGRFPLCNAYNVHTYRQCTYIYM